MSDVDEPESPSGVTSASTEHTRSQTGLSPADDQTNMPTSSASLLGTYTLPLSLRAPTTCKQRTIASFCIFAARSYAKRGLCSRAMSVRPSVRIAARQVRVLCQNK